MRICGTQTCRRLAQVGEDAFFRPETGTARHFGLVGRSASSCQAIYMWRIITLPSLYQCMLYTRQINKVSRGSGMGRIGREGKV